jgi:hypothetical protein
MTHHSDESLPNKGGSLSTDIKLLFHLDGSAQRTTRQKLTAADGQTTEATEVAGFDQQGLQATKTLDIVKTAVAGTETQHTVSGYTGGVETHRTEHDVVVQHGTDEEDSTIDVTQTIDADWDAPTGVTDKTVPTVELSENTHMVTPNGGIHKGTDRDLTITRHAQGPSNALRWDPMRMTVVFEGRDDDRMERVIEYELGADGNPAPGAEPKIVSSTDTREWYEKQADTVRIWGSFATNLVGGVGAALLRSPGTTGTVGKVMFATGLGMGVLNAAAEGYAIYDQQNSAAPARLGMSIYDTVLLGGIGWLNLHGGLRLFDMNLAPAAVGLLGVNGAFGLNSAIDAERSTDLLSDTPEIPEGVVPELPALLRSGN